MKIKTSNQNIPPQALFFKPYSGKIYSNHGPNLYS